MSTNAPMRAIRNAWKGYEVPRCKSKNRRARCVFCPDPNPDSLILDCDKIKDRLGLPGMMCDCIAIEPHGVLHVAVVELKGGSYSSEHAKSQLVAGANLAMDILEGAKARKGVCIHLLVVAPRHRYSHRLSLPYRHVRVRGRRLSIRTVRCGARFSQVIPGAQGA